MSAQGWLDLAAGLVIVIVLVCWAIDGYQQRKSYLRQLDKAAWRRDQYLRERRAELDALQHIPSNRGKKQS